jgi:hypothetical protein
MKAIGKLITNVNGIKMKTKKLQISTLIILLLMLLVGCKKDNIEIDCLICEAEDNSLHEGQMILGERLEDPYNLQNMLKAYSILKSTSGDVPDIQIKPNFNYVRILPSNEKEWQILKSDSSLVLFDYPLDVEIVQPGTYYHDPTLPIDAITWQYTVIPIEKAIPSFQHEVLYQVFIPSSAIDETKSLSIDLVRFYETLEYESVKLTGNLPKSGTIEKSTEGIAAQWTPKGTIKVWDNLLARYIPLTYASVHARWFTHVETDLTDINGYFETDEFRYEVNYAIKWERSYYDIRNGDLLQAWYNGPKQKGDWNLNIIGGESIMYATIHRAAYRHFYGDNLGIWRPILMDGSKTKICYIDKYGTGVFWGDWSSGGILPDIRIWGKDYAGNYRNTNIIFGFTAHELGHQSHSQYMGNIQFWQTSKVIYESWAQAVEWALTNDEYHLQGNKYGVTMAINYNHEGGNQTWTKSLENWEYSPIFIDLIDNYNQREMGSIYPNDLITGFSLSYLNSNILRDSYGLTSLSAEIKEHKVSGVTNSNVDELFTLYW